MSGLWIVKYSELYLVDCETYPVATKRQSMAKLYTDKDRANNDAISWRDMILAGNPDTAFDSDDEPHVRPYKKRATNAPPKTDEKPQSHVGTGPWVLQMLFEGHHVACPHVKDVVYRSTGVGTGRNIQFVNTDRNKLTWVNSNEDLAEFIRHDGWKIVPAPQPS